MSIYWQIKIHSPTYCEVRYLWQDVSYPPTKKHNNQQIVRCRATCVLLTQRLWCSQRQIVRYLYSDIQICTHRQIVLYFPTDCVVLTDRLCCTHRQMVLYLTADYIVLTDRLCCTVLTDRLCCTYRHIELYLPTYCIVLTDILCCTYRQIVTRWQICSYRPLQIHGINYDDL